MSDAELLSIFWVEVSEYLTTLNNGLLEVEMAEGETRAELLREMNRVAHSMKGAARAVGIGLVETLAHYMEEIFSAAQKNTLELTPEAADSLYDSLDIIQNVMNAQENKEEVVTGVIANLEKLIALIGEEKVTDKPQNNLPPPPKPNMTDTSREIPAIHINDEIKAPTPSPPPLRAKFKTIELDEAGSTILMRPAEETIRVSVRKLDRLMAEASELLIAKMQGEELGTQVRKLRRLHSRWLREWRNVRAAYIRLVRRVQEENDEMNSELGTLFKFLEVNQRYLTESGRELGLFGQAIAQNNMHLSTLADELQSDISTLRMMPFETIVGGLQRMVRDLSRDIGKQAHLTIIGGGVDIDKTVLDALNDPLLHLLRNAVDHGIESPAEREASGKPPTGHIGIHVEQRGSEIIIRVSDDGRGIFISKIRDKALQNGLITEADLELMSDDEIRQLIFQSGFSTSNMVTAVSGRGLGMDIVRTRVEGLRGQIQIQSDPGMGTVFVLRMPVSLTRIRCILLEIGGESYAIPSIMVSRMKTIQRDEVYTAEGKDMILVNDRPTPLVSLGAILDIPSSHDTDNDTVQLLVLQTAERAIAFEVDVLLSEIELVLKPLGPELTHTPYVSGAAILGTGEIVIVLDANDLVRKASGAALPARRTINRADLNVMIQQRPRVLIVDDSITTRTLEKNILETAGFDVYVAIDGVEAWSMLNEIDFDVVVSDVEMPNMNGLELTARIKGTAQTQHLPVILLTSLGKPEQREAGLHAGADSYLIKSQFDQGELLEAIQDVM